MSITRSITRALTQPLTRALTGPGAEGGAAPFVPDAAYFAGRQGLAFDLKDLSLLFQNSNGTGAVAYADPVGYATDISGNGHHGTAAGSARPIASSAGAVFDGSTSILSAGSLDLSGETKVMVVVAVEATTTGNLGAVGFGNSSPGHFGCIMYSGFGNVWAGRLYGSTGSSAVSVSNSFSKPVPPFTRVMTFQFDLAGATASDEVSLRGNGDPEGTSVGIAGPAGGGNLANATCTIGDWQSFKLNGKITRLVIMAGNVSTQERFNAEAWCGQSAGIIILPEVPPIDADINHFPTYGQSLSIGAQSRAAISTVANSHYMFTGTGEVRAQESAEPYTALVNHFESDSTLELLGETPCYGAYQIIEEVAGYSRQFLASAPGQGSETIANLSAGGYFARFMDNVTNGRKLARAAGKSFKLRAFMWMQGEGDGTNNSYAADMATLQGNVNTSVKAVTKQTDDVWCLSYQLARAKIGLAHLDASDTYDNIRVAMPMYFLPTTDGVHLTAASSKIAGAYFGLAYKAIILDGDTDWQPLKCTGSSVASQTIDLTYNRSGLAFDTTTVAAQAAQGFHVVNAGLTPLTVSSVTIVGGNTIRIVVASGTPAKVYYGFSDPTDHTANIAKGNLRDSQGDTIVFDGGGLDYPMHNWAVLQSVTL